MNQPSLETSSRFPFSSIPEVFNNPSIPLGEDFLKSPMFSSQLNFMSQKMDSEMEKKLKNLNLSNYPEFDNDINYYHEFWLMYLQNELIIAKMRDFVGEIKTIKTKITTFEENIHSLEQAAQTQPTEATPQKKKNRRTSDQIDKGFKCPYEKCQKSYGSDVSLNLHIKLKHKGGNKTDREKLAQTLVVAKLLGDKENPEFAASFPPGYLENFYAFHKNKRKKNFDAKDLLKQCELSEEQKQNLLEKVKREETLGL